MAEVTVVIPVGPNPSNKQWLDECLDSVYAQSHRADEILLIDDGAKLDFAYAYDPNGFGDLHVGSKTYMDVRRWKSPWPSGVAHAFNFGVSLARNNLVLMLGSDDWLDSRAIELLLETYEEKKQMDAYYSFTIRYSDNGELQNMPCNCAAVTKGLWRLTGGFPPEAEVGACDSIFISMMLKHHPKRLIRVAYGYPLYNYRRHEGSDTGTRPVAYQGVIHTVRDIYTTNWKQPSWT